MSLVNYDNNGPTVDGRTPANSPVEVGSVSRYLQGFIHPGWCRISSTNSSPSLFNYTSISFLAMSL